MRKGLGMRSRLSWLVLVVAVAFGMTWLATAATVAAGGGTDLAATPCVVVGNVVTIVKDPRVRFTARIVMPDERASMDKIAPTTVDFIALPSGKRLQSVRLGERLSADMDVPTGTTQIGVRLVTNGKVDRTLRPPTRDNVGRYPVDGGWTAVIWSLPYATKATSGRTQ